MVSSLAVGSQSMAMAARKKEPTRLGVSSWLVLKKWKPGFGTVVMSLYVFICTVPSVLSVGANERMSDYTVLY